MSFLFVYLTVLVLVVAVFGRVLVLSLNECWLRDEMRFRLLVEVVIVLVIELLIALVVVFVAVRELKDDFYLKGKSEHR